MPQVAREPDRQISCQVRDFFRTRPAPTPPGRRSIAGTIHAALSLSVRYPIKLKLNSTQSRQSVVARYEARCKSQALAREPHQIDRLIPTDVNERRPTMAIQIVMDHTGDTRYSFDAKDVDALANAEARF